MKPIKTWDEVDALLSDLAAIDSAIEKRETERDRECQEIKEKHGKHIKNNEAIKKLVLENLESFFIKHEDDSEVKGKTFEGAYGKCGLRMTPPSVKPIGRMTWERVLSRILELGYKTKLLRPVVHTIKDIDREMLATEKVTDDLRKEIGVKLHQEERFWYEVK